MTGAEQQSRARGLRDDWVSAPALAVAAAMVAWATLGSFGVLNGTTYVQVYGDRPGPDDSRQLLAGLLGAALSCIPVLLGLLATRRTSADDPSWVLPVARGAVLVASIAVVLRVVAALLAGSTSDAFFSYG